MRTLKRFSRYLVPSFLMVGLVSLGAPYALDDYPDSGMRICTYSDVPVSQQALADFLVRLNSL